MTPLRDNGVEPRSTPRFTLERNELRLYPTEVVWSVWDSWAKSWVSHHVTRAEARAAKRLVEVNAWAKERIGA